MFTNYKLALEPSMMANLNSKPIKDVVTPKVTLNVQTFEVWSPPEPEVAAAHTTGHKST
jgi:hypothetical protein